LIDEVSIPSIFCVGISTSSDHLIGTSITSQLESLVTTCYNRFHFAVEFPLLSGITVSNLEEYFT
jgi:hypothetical protein